MLNDFHVLTCFSHVITNLPKTAQVAEAVEDLRQYGQQLAAPVASAAEATRQQGASVLQQGPGREQPLESADFNRKNGGKIAEKGRFERKSIWWKSEKLKDMIVVWGIRKDQLEEIQKVV